MQLQEKAMSRAGVLDLSCCSVQFSQLWRLFTPRHKPHKAPSHYTQSSKLPQLLLLCNASHSLPQSQVTKALLWLQHSPRVTTRSM